MPKEFPWNFEQEPWSELHDEASINLRAYFDRMTDARLREYSTHWSDEVSGWDGNFRSDGAFLLVCSERDVEIEEYRRVLEECIRYRDRVRPK